MAKVVYTEKSLYDLDGIEAYLSGRSPEDARRFISQLDEVLHALAEMPLMGRARDDLRTGVRMFVHRRHVVLYSLMEEGIVVERVASPYQNYEGMLEEP